MDDEEDPWVDWLLPDRWAAVIGLIVAICVGFWQVFVIVADHQRGQPGDGREHHGPCRASPPDAAGCRLPTREAD
jgi:hypothetical protein